MDTSRQLYDREATGWKRGLYDEIKATFRAPIVNWIFRTLMASVRLFLDGTDKTVKPRGLSPRYFTGV